MKLFFCILSVLISLLPYSYARCEDLRTELEKTYRKIRESFLNDTPNEYLNNSDFSYLSAKEQKQKINEIKNNWQNKELKKDTMNFAFPELKEDSFLLVKAQGNFAAYYTRFNETNGSITISVNRFKKINGRYKTTQSGFSQILGESNEEENKAAIKKELEESDVLQVIPKSK